MADVEVENYKKSVTHAVERWNKKLVDINKELAPIQEQIDKLEANNHPSDDDKKKLKDLQKQRGDLRQRVDAANLSLKADLILRPLNPNADKKEAAKLPDWMEKLIKDKGVAISKYIVISADVGIDFKTGKITKFVPLVNVKW
jgi:predicted  nucleic acid-binding Zn-ribbon protein